MLRAKLNELFGIDPRSLAALRVGLALMLLADAYVRFSELDAMYADTGLLSIEGSQKILRESWCWSLNYLNGSPEFQGALLAVAAVAATALLVGWQTWWATLVCWVLLASVHVRMPLTPNGGDQLLRLMLFWSLFVPLGRVWSLDAALRREQPSLVRVVSPGTAALMIQLTLIYLFTALFKSNEDWFSGKALYYAYSLDWSARPWGTYMLEFPELLKVLTWATLGLEWGMAVLVWSPWQTYRLRFLAIAAFVVLHLVIHVTMTVGLFSAISIAAWAVFLPREFWECRPLAWLTAKLAACWPHREPGKSPEPAAPNRIWLGAYRLAQGLCLAMIFYVIGVNIISYLVSNYDTFPASVLRLGQLTATLQKWDMFGRVTRSDGWFAARARLRDGEVVDVLRGGAPYSKEKPERVSAIFPTQHWRYYFHIISQPLWREQRQSAAEYMVRSWNKRHGDKQQIVLLELMYFHEDAELHPQKGEQVTEKWARVQADEEEGGDNFADAIRAVQSGEEIP